MILLLFHVLLACELVSPLNNKELPTLAGGVDKHAVFNQPLTTGVYTFTEDGFIPSQPLERIRKIHKEMIQAIQSIRDHKKQVSYLLTLCNTAHEDMKKLREKINSAGIKKGKDWRTKDTKADVFLLLASHAALVGNAVLYFPDTMNGILKKNNDFADNVKWTMEFSSEMNIINEPTLLKLFHLAKQEMKIAPKDPDYQNPYKGQAVVVEQPTTTTKKPRKKLRRGPRLSGGEL